MTKHVDGFKTPGEIIAESPMIRDRRGLPNHNLTHFWSTDGIECLWCGAVRTADQIAEWDRAGVNEETLKPPKAMKRPLCIRGGSVNDRTPKWSYR